MAICMINLIILYLLGTGVNINHFKKFTYLIITNFALIVLLEFSLSYFVFLNENIGP